MPLWKNTQHAFVAGQLDSLVMGRQDMATYFKGATSIKNFLVRRQGCISKRRGTDLTANLSNLLGTKYSGTSIVPQKMRLVPVTNGDDGRYLILSGGTCFVANRDGILTADRNHIRAIPSYVAEDIDGNPLSIGSRKDARASNDTPVDLIHRISAGNYSVTRFSTLQSAIDAAVNGDTIKLHGNLLITEEIKIKATKWTDEDGNATTVTWNSSPRTYTCVSGGKTYTSYETDYSGNRYALTATRYAITATRRWEYSDGLTWSFSASTSQFTFSRPVSATASIIAPEGSPVLTFTYKAADVTATPSWTFSDSGAWSVSYDTTTAKFTFSQEGYTSITADASAFTGTSIVFTTTTNASITATATWTFSDGKTWTISKDGSSLKAGRTLTASVDEPNVGVAWATTATFTIEGDTTTASTVWTFVGHDYDSTKTYTMSWTGFIWSMSDGTTKWSSRDTQTTYTDTITIVSTTIGFTLDEQTMTLDLNGYKITCSDSNSGVRICNKGIKLTVTSSRTGAKWTITKGEAVLVASGSDRISSGSLIVDGNIRFVNYNAKVFLSYNSNITINSGTFTSYMGGSIIQIIYGGKLTINGGTFNNLATTGGARIVDTFNSGSYKDPNADVGIVINGGTFTIHSSSYGSSPGDGYDGVCAFIIRNSQWPTHIYGGRFSAPTGKNYIQWTAAHGSVFLYLQWSVLHRGEFDHEKIYELHTGILKDLSEFTADGSVENETMPGSRGTYGVKVQGEGDYIYDGNDTDKRPFRISIPYADDDLSDLCIRQSGDTLFIAHRDYPPAKIYFDEYGCASFDELEFDNTSVEPPSIDSAEMDGYIPEETDWPAEFPYSNTSGTVVNTGCPTWLTSGQKTAIWNFRVSCIAKGVVTNAGFSGNRADGSDGSANYACSYTCTIEDSDLAVGKKQTTVSVLSLTKTITKETTTTYTNGVATGETVNTITTTGDAQNDASASTKLVSRTVRYVATYVKEGKESRPSIPVAIDYSMPWPNNAVVNVQISKGSNTDEPEYYNIYKDNGNGYGLIGTTQMDQVSGGTSGFVNTYPLFIPDNTSDVGAIVCAADYEEKKGWANGDILRKMISTGRDTFSSSPSNDVCLINSATNASNGIVFDFSKNGGSRFNKIKVMLDGRLYDKSTNLSYVIVSPHRVTATITYNKTDGTTTGTISKTADTPVFYAFGGISGASYYGTYKDWVGLQRKSFYTPNGDLVYGWLYGEDDQAEMFNTHLRYVEFDFYDQMNAIADFKNVKSVKFTFATSVYSYWTDNQQGCIHAIHFMNRGANATSGMFQDDYINPDMTVTPPSDADEPHFSSADDYPGSVGIYQQRLCFASTNNQKSTLWLSRVADLYNFTPHDSIREDDAMELTLAATEFPKLNHLIAGRDLMLFGDGGEWLISPVQGNTLSYKTASAKLQSMIGSDRALNPLQLADETLFAERGGTCLRSINYNYSSDSYQSQDLSVLAQSIFRANPIVSMAYKQHPDSIVECVLNDGRVATLVYMREQEVMAWSVQELAGGWKALEIVTPKCIVDGTTEMMLLVKKDGAYQLWKVRNDDDTLTAAKQVILDAIHIEENGTAATGETAVDLGDGTWAHGLQIESVFVSVRPEPEKGTTAQMEIKNATEAEIRVIDASTFSVKPYNIETGWREVTLDPTRNGTAVSLKETDVKKLLTGTNNRDGRIELKHVTPWPITILSISNTYQVEYENGGGDK